MARQELTPKDGPPIDNAVFDLLADEWWEEEAFLHTLRSIVNPWRVPFFRRKLAELGVDPQGLRALDVGCGGGLLTEEFEAMGFAVTGIDPSIGSLAVAWDHAAARGLRIDYGAAVGERLPFRDGTFDVVYCCDVLEHVADWQAVVGESARVLRRGGAFLFETLNRTRKSRLIAIRAAQQWRCTRLFPPNFHRWEMFITPEELRHALARHGLLHLETVGGKPRLGLLRSYLLLRRLKKGRISQAEFGRRLHLQESRDLSVSYAGCAVKPDGP